MLPGSSCRLYDFFSLMTDKKRKGWKILNKGIEKFIPLMKSQTSSFQ